jgi:hypothetical protein
VAVKQNKVHNTPTVFADIVPLTPADLVDDAVVWSGRNGWLKEYNQISSRRHQERQNSAEPLTQEPFSDYMYDSFSPPGNRRASCTTDLDAFDF